MSDHMKFAIVAGLLLLCSALLASCSTDVCACEPVPATARITGIVTDVTGTPVANAVVSAFSDDAPGCHSIGIDFGPTAATSADDGSFLMILALGTPQDSVCVFTYAQPNDGIGGLDGSDTTLVVLDFSREQPDTATVDFTLPAE
ncbi:MAG TPA: hypothetical protein VIG08_06500 [Gemmatimonadales bacterium]|jgi:hypothetical protein